MVAKKVVKVRGVPFVLKRTMIPLHYKFNETVQIDSWLIIMKASRLYEYNERNEKREEPFEIG